MRAPDATLLAVLPLSEHGVFAACLPPGAAGQWCWLGVWSDAPAIWWAKVEVTDPARRHVVREAFFGAARRRRGGRQRAMLLHLPGAAAEVVIRIFTAVDEAASTPVVSLRVLGRGEATLRLLLGAWRDLPGAVWGRLPGLAWRVRVVVGQGAARRGQAPPYGVWVRLHEPRPCAAQAAAWAPDPAMIVAIVGADELARAQTEASLAAPGAGPVRVKLTRTLRDCLQAGSAWVVVIAAGETLAPHALACFALAQRRHPGARGFYADLDCIDGQVRTQPLFKPQTPDPWLLRSGLLTRGACMFHRSVLEEAAADWDGTGEDADSWRLALAGRLGRGEFRAIGLILTHVPVRMLRPACMLPAPAGGNWPMVSIVMPSACRSAHVVRSVRQIISRTNYPALEILLAVSCIEPNSRAQMAVLRRLGRMAAVRVCDLRMGSFNYAAVNNGAVRQARGDLLLLLNDDVVPIEPDWLRRLVANLQEPAGIVGARLLYGNHAVQHGGVIMGLGNLCEHAFRLLPARAPGPHGLARLTRQVSSVTGACMLLRRALYESLNGMDEEFSIALNDVDFCLRASAGGAAVKLAADVELYHIESRSLGRHYQGARAALEAVEVQRLRARWPAMIAADPFYNPQASLEMGREFQPAFPPRQTALSWMATEELA
jgi:hypothetical protein